MRHAASALALATLLCGGAGAAETALPDNPTELDVARAEASALALDLGARLKTELLAAMQAGGPLSAVSVCRERAGPLALGAGGDTGWEVGRTSLRVRNPDNAPDSWERAALEAMAGRAAAGEPVDTLVHEAVVEVGAHRYYRFMKAIPTQELCTVCHGETLEPGLAARIRELYPDDRATGFRPGDIRGAFTVTGRLEP